jgi:hypothetical protein
VVELLFCGDVVKVKVYILRCSLDGIGKVAEHGRIFTEVTCCYAGLISVSLVIERKAVAYSRLISRDVGWSWQVETTTSTIEVEVDLPRERVGKLSALGLFVML